MEIDQILTCENILAHAFSILQTAMYKGRLHHGGGVEGVVGNAGNGMRERWREMEVSCSWRGNSYLSMSF